MERAFLVYLNRPESVRLLDTPDGVSSFRYLLFSQERLPWSGPIRNALLEIMQSVETDDKAYEKANDFLDLIIAAGKQQSNYVRRASAIKIVQDREFVAALWAGLTSRPIPFGWLQPRLSQRKALLELGANGKDLPLSAELQKTEMQIAAEAADPKGSGTAASAV